MPTIAVIAPGAMGAALGQRIAAHGARVLTDLVGRSAASLARAQAAGMIGADLREIAEADIILSVLPPSHARALAERLIPALSDAPRKPIYADCNAVSPETVRGIAVEIAATGCPFVDVGIIGGPPNATTPGPVLYASGDAAARLAPLVDLGLDLRVLNQPVGAASALKMSYAGITKGFTALGTAMLLAAKRAAVDETLAAELLASQPALSAWLKRQIPGMYGKAYRWVGEMEEIAQFLQAADGPAAIHEGAARLYETIARDFQGEKRDIAMLDAILQSLSKGPA